MALPKNTSLSAGGSHAGESHEHITPLSVYLGVFGALLVLTVVTVAISYMGIPQPWSLIIAMAVATMKATLVCSVFMHLIWDKRLNVLVFVGAVFFMIVFFALTMTDLLSREMVDPLHGGQVMLEEQQKAYEACMEEKKEWAACKDMQPKGFFYADPDYSEDHAPAGHEAPGGHAKDAAPKDDHGKASH